jgi:hypothetical protein
MQACLSAYNINFAGSLPLHILVHTVDGLILLGLVSALRGKGSAAWVPANLHMVIIAGY